MKFLSHIRSRSRLKSTDETPTAYQAFLPGEKNLHSWRPPNLTASLPPKLVEELLTYVCPHSQDDTYTACEESMVDGGCMLCDLRDLAQCALVDRQWSEAAQNVLYHNVRIDAVHYCDREIDLVTKRRRRSFNGRSGDLRDPAQERLQLFSRTVREECLLAARVQYLKMPYMTRESCKADLARTVSVLPNLRYVDLPDEFYNDSSSSKTLKQELQARCPDIRRMKYASGAEESFMSLIPARQWQNLESLELCRLSMEPSALAHVLSSLTALREIELADLPTLDNSIFSSMSFPALTKLTFKEAPNITVEGLLAYLAPPKVSHTLRSLTLVNTGILPSTLHQILRAARTLTGLHISEAVSRPFPIDPPPLLASHSLHTLHYEISISTSSTSRGPHGPSESYYTYLSTSLLSGALPSLTTLYALSPHLPTLLLPEPGPAFANSIDQPESLQLNLTHPLSLYTKLLPEMEWDITLLSPPALPGFNPVHPTTRPVSLYHAPQLSPQWRDKGRESVIVGNGFGGFLTVPGEAGGGFGSPGKGKGKERRERDAWMG